MKTKIMIGIAALCWVASAGLAYDYYDIDYSYYDDDYDYYDYYPYHNRGVYSSGYYHNPHEAWHGEHEYGAGEHVPTGSVSSPYHHGVHHGYHYSPEEGWHRGTHYGHE